LTKIPHVDEAPERRLGEFARARSGIFTWEDAERLGIPEREVAARLRSGEWTMVHGGGIRAATTPLTMTGRERAALARFGHPGALSHLSAARHWRIPAPPPSQVWLSVPSSRRIRSVPGVRIYRSRHLSESAISQVDGLPVLNAARTVADLALLLDERPLAAAALAAMQRMLCTADEIIDWKDRLAGRPGSAVLARALREADPAFESILSAEFGRLLRESGETLVPAYVLHLPDGGYVVCDFADPERRIDFEADGLAFHSTPEQVARDKARDRRLLAVGWITVRFGTDDIRRRPMETVAEVRRQRAAWS
jgi:very-short-patch-repair endonuclease